LSAIKSNSLLAGKKQAENEFLHAFARTHARDWDIHLPDSQLPSPHHRTQTL
jgi:hypothetical protein